MKVYDALTYKKAKEKVKELKKLITQLDVVGEILYNNVTYNSIWNLIQHFEDVRIQYYMELHENSQILKNKGKISDEQRKNKH